MSTPRIISTSEVRTFRRCAREHYHSYVLGFRPVLEAEVLRFGRLVHVGLEAWWRAPADRLAAALAAMQSTDPYEQVRAEVSLQGYDARWADEPYDTLAVEAEFRAPLMNPTTKKASRTFRIGGRLDVVVRDRRDGEPRLLEHKTASEDIGPGSDYWKRLTLDPQISIYFAGGQALGYPIRECIYDVLGKPALRPATRPLTDRDGFKIVHNAQGVRMQTKTGKWRETSDTASGFVLQTRPETPEEFRARLVAHVAEEPERYYQRGTVVRLEQETLDAAHDLWGTARMIRDALRDGRWPRNPDSCIRWGRACAYLDVCCGTASLEDPALYRKVTQTHEELSSDAA